MMKTKLFIMIITLTLISAMLLSCGTEKSSISKENKSENSLEKETGISLDTLPLNNVSPDLINEDEAEEKETKDEQTQESGETDEETREEEDPGEPAVEVGADGITRVNGILVANKTYSLPEDYAPGVDPTANAALEKMFDAAADDGISLWVVSGYRSYDHQYNTYYGYVARSGQAEADRYSARPGHSEHQTGLAFDLNSLEQSFGETAAGKWLKAHCHEYGFIIRYPEDKESVTGYMYEPWHVRYLGEDIAADVFESGLCLEEYLGITSAYND